MSGFLSLLTHIKTVVLSIYFNEHIISLEIFHIHVKVNRCSKYIIVIVIAIICGETVTQFMVDSCCILSCALFAFIFTSLWLCSMYNCNCMCALLHAYYYYFIVINAMPCAFSVYQHFTTTSYTETPLPTDFSLKVPLLDVNNETKILQCKLCSHL